MTNPIPYCIFSTARFFDPDAAVAPMMSVIRATFGYTCMIDGDPRPPRTSLISNTYESLQYIYCKDVLSNTCTVSIPETQPQAEPLNV